MTDGDLQFAVPSKRLADVWEGLDVRGRERLEATIVAILELAGALDPAVFATIGAPGREVPECRKYGAERRLD